MVFPDPGFNFYPGPPGQLFWCILGCGIVGVVQRVIKTQLPADHVIGKGDTQRNTDSNGSAANSGCSADNRCRYGRHGHFKDSVVPGDDIGVTCYPVRNGPFLTLGSDGYGQPSGIDDSLGSHIDRKLVFKEISIFIDINRFFINGKRTRVVFIRGGGIIQIFGKLIGSSGKCQAGRK